MNTGDKTSGGEGGIRTLGTGVSPYNGLANESSLAALTRFKDLQSDSGPPSRAQGFSFGSYCAPLCAPTCPRFGPQGFVLKSVRGRSWLNAFKILRLDLERYTLSNKPCSSEGRCSFG